MVRVKASKLKYPGYDSDAVEKFDPKILIG
jgi:hypothetical protein